MYAKMKDTMKWGCDNHGDKTYKNGTHWSIDFLPLKKLQKPILTVSLLNYKLRHTVDS